MIDIGRINTLKIVRESNHGLYLEIGEEDEILLPNRYVPEKYNIGDEIDVFVSFDSEDRMYASTDMPYAMVGEYACLEVVAATSFGAFLDWGMPKDLLVPFKEQNQKMKEGEKHVVYIYFDSKSKRIAASAKLFKFLKTRDHTYEKGDEVELIICSRSDLGYNVLIDGDYMGLLFKSDVFKPVQTGDKMKGYIKEVRDDLKLDVCLSPLGKSAVDLLASRLVEMLEENNGFLPVTDKSSSDEINSMFGQSKKTFKRSVGLLYKQRKIKIEDKGISLI